MFFDTIVRIVAVLALTGAAYLLTRALVVRFAFPLLRRTRPNWAPVVERSRLLTLTALLVAVLTLGVAVGLLEQTYPEITSLVRLLDTAVGIGVLAWMLATMGSLALAIYEQQPLAKEVPLTGFVQLVQGSIFLIGFLMIVAVFLGVPAIYSFAALAAIFTALGFVFQDPIMGFVAGIQLAANKMVAIGDWIEVSAYGANGAVKEILMSTVKVQNWDNTVTTVPTRALISDSFKNWRPMYVSGGRRMQRAIYLDIHAVRPVAPALLERFPLLAETWQRIGAGDLAADGILVEDAARQPTNLGIYRVYLTDYLHRHPHVNTAMMHMVRQLDPADDGLPLEVYAFLLDTGWPTFETTASSIFEHIYASAPQFGLRPFQRPLSVDIGDPVVAVH
jgi:miniconductance mechanosensitive channel